MEYRVLGRVEVRRNGSPLDLGAFRQRSLLALLLMRPNSVVSTDQILEQLWDEDAADRQNTLWVYVSNLRKVLEPEREKRSDGTVLLTRPPGYVLHVEPHEIDAVRFERMVAEGRALAETDPAAGSLILREALALWTGHAYEDYTYEAFAQTEIARLEELRLEAVESRIDADLRRGMSRELVSELETLVRQHPLREQFTSQLMLALYRSGRQAEALRTYQSLKARLGDELGIEPSTMVRSLEERIVTGDPSLDAASGRASGTEPGLAIRGYELREKIGEGAFGVAYRAFQPAVGREVAIKVIRPELANSPTFIRRFEAEAQLVARLEHPQIVPLYDYWREPDAAYLVMRLMKGGSLADVIAASALDDAQAATVAEDIGAALRTAHDHGVVHRDIKPANVLIDAAGHAYLSDFGIAVAGDPKELDDYLQAVTLGPPYASPEQAQRGAVTASSDIYSLGVVLAQALTGLRGEIDQIRGALAPPVARVIDRATHRSASERFADVDEFVTAFVSAVGRDVADDARAEAVRNPYKGLQSFGPADAGDFFGREALVERLVDRLGKIGVHSRFVALVGPSGAGKSSVVRAGLLPALQREAVQLSNEWFVVDLTPAPHPFEELESALLTVAVDPPSTLLDDLMDDGGLRRVAERVLPVEGSQLLVVVDQFEELFTQVDPEVAQRFLNVLADAITHERSRVRIVATMRADFYDRPLRHAVIGELLRNGTEVITPMTHAELERAIAGPAETVGVGVDPALIGRLISDVADRPGALPLLQYTLTELFEARKSAHIAIDAYDALGGISGALAERAEGLVAGLSPSAQDCSREVFLSLITLGEGTEDTRRRVLVSELEQLPVDRHDLATVLETFGRHRMLSFDRDPITRGPTVEISHEALLTEWSRLRRLIDESRIDVRQQRNLRRAAIEWHAAQRDESFLLTPGRLARFEEWLPVSTVRVGGLEEEYLAACRERRDRAEAEEAAQRRREAEQLEREAALQEQSNKRLRLVTLVLAVGAAVAAVLGVFGWLQSQEAQRQRDEASAAEAFAEEQAAEALAQRDAAEAARSDADVQRRNVEQTAAVRIAEQLPTRALALRDDDPQLALLLAGESIVAAHEAGLPLTAAVGALHVVLQDAGARFPDTVDRSAIIEQPGDNRAVFVMPVSDLLDLRDDLVVRALTEEECLEHLGRICRQAELRSALPIQVLDESVLAPDPSLHPFTDTILDLAYFESPGQDVFPFHDTWNAETQRFGRAFGSAVVPEGLALWDFESTLLEFAESGLSDIVARRWIAADEWSDVPWNPVLLDGIVDPMRTVPPSLNAVLRSGENQAKLWAWLDVQSTVWYRPELLDDVGVAPPATWIELVEVTRRLAVAGHAPWCFGLQRGTGVMPLMHLVESQVLEIGGVELYDEWLSHDVSASDPRIVQAHRRAAGLLFNDDNIGGLENARQRAGNSPTDLMSATPACAMWIAPPTSAQDELRNRPDAPDLEVFMLPTGASQPLIVNGVTVEILVDRPETRAFVGFLTSPTFGQAAAEAATTTMIAANTELDPNRYNDAHSRQIAQAVRQAGRADLLRVGILDVRPDLWAIYANLIDEWFDGGVEATAGILAHVEEAWQELDRLNAEG